MISLQLWSTHLLSPARSTPTHPARRTRLGAATRALIGALLLHHAGLGATPDPLDSRWTPAQARTALERVASNEALALLAAWQQPERPADLGRRTGELLLRHIARVGGAPERWRDPIEQYKLARALRGGTLDTYLAAMTAPNPVAQALRAAQIRYMRIEARGGWPRIAEGPALQPGSQGARVRTLRRRLIATDDLPARAADSEHFDADLQAAVQRFQRRHQLPDDGVVGERTLRALNVPVHRRLAAIRLSRARAEELPAGSRADYVWVNIAAASTHLVRRQQTIWSGRSVVGKRNTQTPELRSQIETLVLNPFWMVPDSIARHSLLPRQARDPGFLARLRYRAFDEGGRPLDLAATDWQAVAAGRGPKVRLMQSPGPSNALGKVKFLFPNEHAVFLHDTPMKKGFERHQRTLSSGCVRVEGALSLAALLLEPQGWTRERIERKLASGDPLKLKLDTPLPVHTLYLTATAGQDGSVNFYRDSYGRDTASALAQLN